MMIRNCSIAFLLGVTIALAGCSQRISVSPGVSSEPTSLAGDALTKAMPSAGLNQRESGDAFVGLNGRRIVSEEMSLKPANFSEGVTPAPGNPVYKRSGRYAQLRLSITDERVPDRGSVGLLKISGWK